ncbi:MAG: SMI1/KNR4 family protein [Pirellulales bacterium]
MPPTLEARFPILDRLQDSFDPISEAEVRTLEADLGVTLPQDYVEFLLQYNAAYMQHPVEFRVREQGPFVEGGTFDRCLGIVKEWPECESGWNIDTNVEALDQRIPAGLVPIADSGTDPICIGVTADNYGKIYLWDSVDEGADDNTYLVADSFTEFLGCLTPGDESYTYVEELPIFQAIERGELPTVEAYLADGGKVDCRNGEGQTLLMCAARTAWPKIVRLLLQRGADPSARDANDCTPVYHAAMGQSDDGLKLLFAAGADTRYCDERGRTLVKLAEDRAYYRIARLLEKHAAGLL